MSDIPDLSSLDFAPVMDYPEDSRKWYVFDFSKGYDPDFIRQKEWGIGRYNEKRNNMYTTPLFENKRNIHMGIDLWAEAGEPVYSFFDGTLRYKQNNSEDGSYGPTIVVEYILNDFQLFALYGHLSEESLQMVSVDEPISRGQQIAALGDKDVNGGWVPHLHFQLSVEDPGEADMAGVVAEEDRIEALQKFPDPRIVLGDLY